MLLRNDNLVNRIVPLETEISAAKRTSRGIGNLMAQAEGVFDTTGMFPGMALLSFGVLLIGAIVGRVERLLWWERAQDSLPRERFPAQ